MDNDTRTDAPVPEPAPEPASDGKASEGTWGVPLVLLIPVPLIRYLSDLSTPWLVTAWILLALVAVLTVAGWVSVVRHGRRGAKGWGTCLLLHVGLALQVTALV
ncbi:hypothetical protein [Streptomyces griseocarneus]|uniref:hypothetical protein n=1 Tax=Streptomyces griseocarneus TaxID=51201 RepID=UPI00167D8769|nr:hypothetical protein [Streptomyces griseocarneus]MBZ6476208.1 hypothetical protein [Streptomyces griseocarneus]